MAIPTAPFDARHVALPVFGCERLGDMPRQVCGTAFPIGGQYFLTAGHVIRAVRDYPVASLGFISVDASRGATASRNAPITDAEIIDRLDLAVVACEGGPWFAPPWASLEVPLLTQVMCPGYPFALHAEHEWMYLRAYRGHIVAGRPIFQLPARPAGYELSFSAPKGLSGAALLIESDAPVVIGYVIGNERSGMLVHSESEREIVGERETIIEQYEWLNYGVAVSSAAIFDIESRLLATRIGQHLRRHRLLPP